MNVCKRTWASCTSRRRQLSQRRNHTLHNHEAAFYVQQQHTRQTYISVSSFRVEGCKHAPDPDPAPTPDLRLQRQVAEAVGGSVAVAKEAVYPLFDRLGTVQNELTEELRLLVVRDRLFEQATALLGGFASMLPAAGSGKAKVQSVWMAKLAVPSAAELAAQALEGASLQVGKDGLHEIRAGGAWAWGVSLQVGNGPHDLCMSGMLAAQPLEGASLQVGDVPF